MGRLKFPVFLLVLLKIITAEVINLGMFPEVPEYSFYNCRDKMLEMVTKTGGLLHTELNNNANFKSMWQNSKPCKQKIPGGTEEHMTAVQSFVVQSEFSRTFNEALTKSRRDKFPFKSLFFLLTDAMKLLKMSCKTVYSGTYTEYAGKTGEYVRFETFFPAQFEYSDATEAAELSDDLGTVFNITSCSAISDDYMCNIGENINLLISPTEVFRVENIRTVKNTNNNYKEITLMHAKFYSSSNCSALDSSSKLEESNKSSSCFLRFSSLNLVVSLLTVYFCSLTL